MTTMTGLEKASIAYRQWGLLLAATAQDDGWAEINDQYLAAQRMWEDAADRAIKVSPNIDSGVQRAPSAILRAHNGTIGETASGRGGR